MDEIQAIELAIYELLATDYKQLLRPQVLNKLPAEFQATTQDIAVIMLSLEPKYIELDGPSVQRALKGIRSGIIPPAITAVLPPIKKLPPKAIPPKEAREVLRDWFNGNMALDVKLTIPKGTGRRAKLRKKSSGSQ